MSRAGVIPDVRQDIPVAKQSSRQRRSGLHEDRSAQPFNNPFRAQLGKLKREVRDARRRADAERVATKPSAPTTAQPVSAQDERTQFLSAVGDAVPLDSSATRVHSRHDEKTRVVVEDALDFTADEFFDLRFSERYIRGRTPGVSGETMRRLERGEFAVRSHVDLHGMPLDDARTAVDGFLADCQRRGERCVLVITGQGHNSPRHVGVLRENIPQWLACGPSARRILAFVTARQCDGGEGAFYVLLRKHAARKNRIDVEAGGGA